MPASGESSSSDWSWLSSVCPGSTLEPNRDLTGVFRIPPSPV